MTKNEEEKQERNVRPCPRDCSACGTSQQLYCCTKMIFDQSVIIQGIRSELSQVRDELNELKNRDNIDSSDKGFSEPNIAQ